MIVLDGHSLTPSGWIGDVAESISIKERDSTAAWTPEEISGISVNTWLKDETRPGAGIVWRIQSIRQIFNTKTQTIQLEHVINSLKDKIIPGSVGPADITGTTGAASCTAREAVEYILDLQGDWILGEFEYDEVTNPYKFDGETLYEALEKVSNSLEDPWWSYDQSEYPFKLNITHKQSEVGTELRANRNLITIEKTIDKSDMYTRFYPIGKDDLRLSGGYVSKNESVYGVKEIQEVDETLQTEMELTAWATERLNKHAEPVVTIIVDGMELSEATGEPLDAIMMGMFCRVPLPEYATSITERIIEMNYPDAKNSPDLVKITLANSREDVTKIIADAIRKGGKSRRVSTKQNKEDHAWIEDTNNHVALVAEGIVGVDAQGNPNWTRLSEIIVDENGIDATVQSIQNDNLLAWTAIHQNEDAITLEAQRAAGEEAALGASLQVAAGKITQIVTAVGEDGEVTAASICLSINQSGESDATINASKIHLLGQTIADTITANYIKTKIEDISFIQAHTISLDTALNVGGTFNLLGVNCTSLVSGVKSIRVSQPTNNVYTLQYTTYDDSEWQSAGTFSRATTLSGAWSGRNYSVTASPQGNINVGIVYDGIVPDTSDPIVYEKIGNNHYVKRDYIVYSDDGNGDADSIIMKKEVSILANDAYNAGYTDGEASGGSTTLSSSWNGGKITVTASPQGETLERMLQAGAATWNGTTATIPISSVYGSSGQYSEGVVFNPTVDASTKLQTKTATSNGTYTPDNGYIGLSSVTVNTQSYETAHVAGSWGTGSNSNVWTVSKTSSGSSNNVSMTVTAGISAQSYNSSTHKYVAYGYAYGDGVQKASSGGSESGLEAYNDGWGAARNNLSVPTSAATNAAITVLWPSSNVGGQGTTNYYVTADNTYAYIRVGSTGGTVVARVAHSAYSNGQNAAGLSINGNGTNTVTRALSSSTKSVSITATAGISYNSSTHKYTATAQSKAGSTNMGAASATSGTEAYDAGVTATVNGTWFGYTSSKGSSSDSSFIDISTPDTTRYLYAKDRNNAWSRPSITWYLPKAGIFTVSGAGSHHIGDLTPGSYICAGYSRGGYSGDAKYSAYTYRVPGSSASYSFSGISGGNNCPSSNVSGFLAGYTTHHVSVGSKQNQYYQYIKFAVDGRKHAFYF